MFSTETKVWFVIAFACLLQWQNVHMHREIHRLESRRPYSKTWMAATESAIQSLRRRTLPYQHEHENDDGVLPIPYVLIEKLP